MESVSNSKQVSKCRFHRLPSKWHLLWLEGPTAGMLVAENAAQGLPSSVETGQAPCRGSVQCQTEQAARDGTLQMKAIGSENPSPGQPGEERQRHYDGHKDGGYAVSKGLQIHGGLRKHGCITPAWAQQRGVRSIAVCSQVRAP